MAIKVRDALKAAMEVGRPPSFYLDTNVIRDLMRGRRRSSAELFQILEENEWPCVTAYFTYMELFDIEQEARYFQAKSQDGMELNVILASRMQRDLSQEALQEIEGDVYEVLQTKYGIIEWLYLDQDGWDRAIDLASKSNVPAADCIHLATAVIATCDVLVTSDSHLSTNARAYVASGPPEQVLKEIRLLFTGLDLGK